MVGKAAKSWVKICGMTNVADAVAAANAGADAVGFVFVPSSPRAATREEVAKILPALPPSVVPIGVVANEDPDFLRGLLRVCPLHGLQFHGEESPEQVLAFKGKVRFLIKAIRVKNAGSLEIIPFYQGVDAILLDTDHPDRTGGTGVSFDWQLALRAKSFGIPVIVAGGLTPANVAAVIEQVQPFGVDVSSGVEFSPGRKDPVLVREFIHKATSPLS